jgi:hypothetical protein
MRPIATSKKQGEEIYGNRNHEKLAEPGGKKGYRQQSARF